LESLAEPCRCRWKSSKLELLVKEEYNSGCSATSICIAYNTSA